MPGKTVADPKGKILVVDGSATERELISKVLSRAGYEVVAREDSDGAFDAFATERPDLVLLDSDLPKMSGLEICKRLRKQADRRFVAILMLPASPGIDQLAKAVKLGADDFFRKPFYPPELVARVKAGMLTKRLQDELTASKHRIEVLEKANDAGRPSENATGTPSVDLEVLRARFGSLLDLMQSLKARRATRAAFNASPAEMGRSAARRRG